MGDGVTARPMRADARRNYDRLLAEADRAFVAHGADASLDEIARRAGVGIGTLYRHFPTREALLETLLRERFTELADRAHRLLDAESAPAALSGWLTAFVANANTYRGLVAVLMTTLEDHTSELHAACQAMRDGGAALLARAQRAGQARTDIDALELFALASGVAWADERVRGIDPSRAGRLLDVILDGLAAPARPAAPPEG